MVAQFAFQTTRSRFIFICCFAAFFFVIFLAHPRKTFPKSDKNSMRSYGSDVLKRIKNLEDQVQQIYDNFINSYSNALTKTVTEEAKKIPSNSSSFNYTQIKASSFWTGVDTYGQYENLYANRSRDHQTCLVTQRKCDQKYKLLILITTHISHISRRETIRNTWGVDKMKRWKTVFLVGRSRNTYDLRLLSNEIDRHQDIILGDVYEDFYNLTSKVQAGFEWSIRYCRYKYMLKGDDDVFINFPRLFSFLTSSETPTSELYAGNVQYQAHVFRSGRYGVTKNEFQRKTYPRYCSGGGFILTRDVVERMIAKFPNVKRMSIDDAYIGELALRSGIDVMHEDNFRMFEDEKACEFKRDTIVHHPVKSRDCMEKLFKRSLEETS